MTNSPSFLPERRLHLEVTVVCAGPPAHWQAEVRVRGEREGRTFADPAALAEYLRQLGEQTPPRGGLR